VCVCVWRLLARLLTAEVSDLQDYVHRVSSNIIISLLTNKFLTTDKFSMKTNIKYEDTHIVSGNGINSLLTNKF
jgi:hypothetical protein